MTFYEEVRSSIRRGFDNGISFCYRNLAYIVYLGLCLGVILVIVSSFLGFKIVKQWSKNKDYGKEQVWSVHD